MTANYITLDNINLPADMVFDAEFDWSPVRAKVDVTLAGTLVVQRSKQSKGRPLVLRSTDETAWLRRSQLDALVAKRDDLTINSMTLTLADGRSYSVLFDTSDAKCIETTPLQPGKLADSTDYFIASLKFIEV
jgi:hypothetical protein